MSILSADAEPFVPGKDVVQCTDPQEEVILQEPLALMESLDSDAERLALQEKHNRMIQAAEDHLKKELSSVLEDKIKRIKKKKDEVIEELVKEQKKNKKLSLELSNSSSENEKLTKIIKEKDKEIETCKNEKTIRIRECLRDQERETLALNNQIRECEETLQQHVRRRRELMDEIERLTLNPVQEKWIGSTLKMKFIFDQIKNLGVLPEDHADWILPMIDDIEIPEVSRQIQQRYLPSYQDAHIVNVEEVEEMEIYERLSQEASQYSQLLGENPEQTIAAAVFFQKVFRGRRIRILYGENPQRNIKMATLIQKIYRGFRGRGITLQTDIRWLYDKMIMSSRASDRRGIRFVNTRGRNIDVSWIRRDGSFVKSSSVMGYARAIFSQSTFVTHCFVINANSKDQKFFRIPRSFKSGTFFDLATGLSFTKDHWETRCQRPFSTSSRPSSWDFDPCQCSTCVLRREEEDESQLRIAIQMSLESSSEEQEDVPDFGDDLVNMFPDQE